MPEPPANQRQATDQERQWVLAQFESGWDAHNIALELVLQGWSEQDARRLVDSLEAEHADFRQSPQGRRSRARPWLRVVAGGIILAGIGLLLTIISYRLAAPGGRYRIWASLIVAGVGAVLAGLIGWLVERVAPLAEARKYACPNCGYDLRQSKKECPECGAPIPPRAP